MENLASKSTDALRIKEVRDRFSLGVQQAAQAVRIADERYDGDIQLGALWIEAASFAINAADRDAWNDRWARHTAQERAIGKTKFIGWMADRYEAQTNLTRAAALECAAEQYREHYATVEFGHLDYGWGESEAHDLADEDISSWEGES